MFFFVSFAVVEKGACRGCGAALTDPCCPNSTRGLWDSGGSTPDSGAAPGLRAGCGPLPQESGPEQWRRDRELTMSQPLLEHVQNVTYSAIFCYGIYLYKIFISIYIDIYLDRIFIEGILFLIALFALFLFPLTAELTSVLTLVCWLLLKVCHHAYVKWQ